MEMATQVPRGHSKGQHTAPYGQMPLHSGLKGTWDEDPWNHGTRVPDGTSLRIQGPSEEPLRMQSRANKPREPLHLASPLCSLTAFFMLLL